MVTSLANVFCSHHFDDTTVHSKRGAVNDDIEVLALHYTQYCIYNLII